MYKLVNTILFFVIFQYNAISQTSFNGAMGRAFKRIALRTDSIEKNGYKIKACLFRTTSSGLEINSIELNTYSSSDTVFVEGYSITDRQTVMPSESELWVSKKVYNFKNKQYSKDSLIAKSSTYSSVVDKINGYMHVWKVHFVPNIISRSNSEERISYEIYPNIFEFSTVTIDTETERKLRNDKVYIILVYAKK